jgi:hypothetical protein
MSGCPYTISTSQLLKGFHCSLLPELGRDHNESYRHNFILVFTVQIAYTEQKLSFIKFLKNDSTYKKFCEGQD